LQLHLKFFLNNGVKLFFPFFLAQKTKSTADNSNADNVQSLSLCIASYWIALKSIFILFKEYFYIFIFLCKQFSELKTLTPRPLSRKFLPQTLVQ